MFTADALIVIWQSTTRMSLETGSVIGALHFSMLYWDILRNTCQKQTEFPINTNVIIIWYWGQNIFLTYYLLSDYITEVNYPDVTWALRRRNSPAPLVFV